MFNAQDVYNELGIPQENQKYMIPGWGTAMAAMPDEIPILQPELLDEVCRIGSLDRENTARIRETADAVRKSPALRAFLWHACYKMSVIYQDFGTSNSPNFMHWALPEKVLGRNARLFYTLVILSVIPEAVRNFKKVDTPDEVIKATLDVQGEMEISKQKFGEIGSDPNVIYWWRNYAKGRLFRLGRFKYKVYEILPFGVMLRNRRTRHKLLLAEPGFKFNKAGFAVQDGMEAPDDQTTIFEETETCWKGYAVHPAGYIRPGIGTFRKSEWEAVLRMGDPVLEMHIPGGGGMKPEIAYESFVYAFRFFKERFPNRFAPAIFCTSWVFNTQFEEMLPESNLAALMRKCYLYPVISCGRDGFSFLFGRDYENLADAPHDTSYRRAMLSVLERGDRLRLGGMLFFEEDLGQYYQDVYRRNFDL